MLAAALGALSLLGSHLATELEVGSVTITFDWAWTFAMLAALGSGLRGALIAALLGGFCWVPFGLWPNNGWGNVVSSVLLSGWVIAQGVAVEAFRRRDKPWWLHPLAAQVAWSSIYAVAIPALYPWVLSFNPAPWCGGGCLESIPSEVLVSIGLKSFVNSFVAALGAWVALRVRAVRLLFGLPLHHGSEHNGRLIAVVLGACAALHFGSLALPELLEGAGVALPLVDRPLTSKEVLGLMVFLAAGLGCSLALVHLVEGLRARELQVQQVAAEQLSLHAELEQARRLEDLGQLAGGVAHDFNNMLAGIFASLESLDTAPQASPEVREAVDSIALAARAARDLTKQLLDASAEAPSHRCAVDVHEAIESAGKMLRRTLPAVITIDYALHALEHHCYVDATQFQSAVVNLGINAGHAMPEGGTLRIRTWDSRGGDGEIVVDVTDTGAGISEEVIERVFEPFFTTRQGAGGTGLGLASVKAFCERAGGRVELISSPGRGTTVRMYLLRATVSQHRIVARPALSESSQQERTALVIDDDDLARRGSIRQLRSLGYATLEARDGVEGTRTFAESRDGVDVVLLDVQMPTMSGPECLRHLREIDPHVPVVFCTGYVGAQEMIAELQAAHCPILRKPFDRLELQEALSTVLGDLPSSRRAGS